MSADRAVPLIIDCDPGVDDALCLALALASPEVDVLAVTTVAGNAPIEVTTTNASSVLAAAGRSDIPVAAGAIRGLVHAYDHGLPPPHGDNGLGDIDVAPSPVPPKQQHALYLLRDVLAAAEPQSITVVATAPLTNIALLAAVHPELLDRIDRVVVMGGSTGRGNITPVAEFNTWTDPEAAQRVLSEPALNLVLVGLDVTRHARISISDLDAIRSGSPLGAMLADMVLGYRDRNDQGWAIHDVVTVAAVIQPALLHTVRALVEVDTSVSATRGQTICEYVEPADARVAGLNRYAAAGQVQLASWLEVEPFRRLVTQRLGRQPRLT